MTTCNPETGDMLLQEKTFKTIFAAFHALVCEQVRKLNGEYGLWYMRYCCMYICIRTSGHGTYDSYVCMVPYGSLQVQKNKWAFKKQYKHGYSALKSSRLSSTV